MTKWKKKDKKKQPKEESDEFQEEELQFEDEPGVNDDEDVNDEGVEEFSGDEDENDGKKPKKPKKKHFGSFKTMGLLPALQRGIVRKGYNVPTPIQRKAIPIILEGKDVIAMARTGSGKTAAFLVPLFEKLKGHSSKIGVRAILLTPTRELALQTIKFIKQIGTFMDLRSCLLVGGDSMQEQFSDLATNPDIIVATPGRLVHHIAEVGLSLKSVEYVVFDEADRLFEMGLAEQINQIIVKLPEIRQTVMFSATLPQMLVDFAKAGLTNPELIRLDAEMQISDTMRVHFFTTRAEEKASALLYLLTDIIPDHQQTVVFASTRHHCEYLHELLTVRGIRSCVIYGTMDQTARKINIAKFRARKAEVLMVTDVAARGIDIPLLDNVINYDFPPTAKLFIHRAGRVARMGRTGNAYSLVAPDELPYMIDLHLYLARTLQNTVPEGSSFDESDVYYGRLPQDLLDIENDFIKEKLRLHIDLENLYRVTLNAYKLYYKTRAKPSPESVGRAKELPNSALHPLILKRVGKGEQDRVNFLEGIRSFKTKQTIFEVDDKKQNSATALAVMQNARKSHARLLSGFVKPEQNDDGSNQQTDVNMTEASENDHVIEKPKDHSHIFQKKAVVSLDDLIHKKEETNDNSSKKRKSAEKTEKSDNQETEASSANNNNTVVHKKRKSKKTKTSSNDNSNSNNNNASNDDNLSKEEREAKEKEFYLKYVPDDHHREKALTEGLHSKDITLDLAGDDRESIAHNRAVTKWDRKKKKFVKVQPGVDLNSHKKPKSESGNAINVKERGKIYEEWKKRTKSELQQAGEEEDKGLANRFNANTRWKYKHQQGNDSMLKNQPLPRNELKSKEQIIKNRKNQERNKERQKSKKDRAKGRGDLSHAYKPYKQRNKQ